MKRISLLCALFSLFGMLFAQSGSKTSDPADIAKRTSLDPQFAPFYHGVASGDPRSDRVIIWTRVTPDVAGQVTVNWTMATDTAMTNVVQSGTATTDGDVDYTLQVDVTGLQPDTWYYYRFEKAGRFSVIGRTHTAPVGQVDSLRFAVVSCADYPSGFYNAYESIANRNDVCAVLHLGDYIYEGESLLANNRDHDPPYEILNLSDYRARHSQYKLDTNLRWLHQNYPFILVWDDHETANNAWREGAEGHDANEGVWEDRKLAGVRAYLEWMPIRRPDPNDSLRIWRNVRYGDLAEIFMLDTRLHDRDEQVVGSGIDDPNRNLLGPAQLEWLGRGMDTTGAQWKLLGNQVMMAPLEIPFVGPINTDSWDGYRAERQRVYDSILVNNIDNVVVLTGDIHTAFANDLPGSNYDPGTGSGSVAVEFICSSITTPNTGITVGQQLITATNPHIKFVDLAAHGYFILDVNRNRAKADFWFADDISTAGNYGEGWETSWFVNDGERFLRQDTAPSFVNPNCQAIQPPRKPANPAVGISAPVAPDGVLIGVYPNPFWEGFGVKYYLYGAKEVQINMTDMAGRTVMKESLGVMSHGLHYANFDGKALAEGAYIVELLAGDQRFTRRIIKR